MFGPLDFKIDELRTKTSNMIRWLDSTSKEYKDCMNSDDLAMCEEASKKLKEVQELFAKYPY